MSISAVIVAKDEERNLRRCVESVRFADEVILVDSGSADGTVELAGSLGCKVVFHEWEGYARQKNFAVSQASGDWVLSLDADEEIAPELADEIRAAVESGSAEAFEMPRQNMFLGKPMRHGGWYPDRQLRLWRRGAGEFADVPIHEHLLLVEGVRLGRLNHPIVHYTYPTVSDFLRKADAYTEIEAARGRPSISRIITAFPVKFAEVYLYKSGWRDGLHGFVAAVLMSARVFVRQVKIWERNNCKS
ncbi:MAG: glycosyltransferase family 2 protein [Armatimonadota bacterium]